MTSCGIPEIYRQNPESLEPGMAYPITYLTPVDGAGVISRVSVGY